MCVYSTGRNEATDHLWGSSGTSGGTWLWWRGTKNPCHTSQQATKACGLTDLLGHTYSNVEALPKSLSLIAGEEMKRYKEITPLACTEDPLSWWKSHDQFYPFLAKLEEIRLIYLSQVLNSFSTAGDIVIAQRNTLPSMHVDQLLFLSRMLIFLHCPNDFELLKPGVNSSTIYFNLRVIFLFLFLFISM